MAIIFLENKLIYYHKQFRLSVCNSYFYTYCVLKEFHNLENFNQSLFFFFYISLSFLSVFKKYF